MTKYEQAILELIEESHSHMTAEQVHGALRQRYPAVVLATVYNNLNKLTQSGKVRRITVEGMPDRYDRRARHDHLVCDQCGALVDVDAGDLTEQLQKLLDTPLLGYDLRLLYLCEECRKKQTCADKERSMSH